MTFRRQRAGHGALRKITSTRAAFARPGPGATPFPDVDAPTQPSDSLASFSRGSGSPRRRPTSWGKRLFCRRCRWPVRAPADAPVLEMNHRLSVQPEAPEERQGPPGLLGRPLRACRGATPRRTRPLLAPTSLREDLRRGRHRLREKQNARHPEWHSFRGHVPTAHTLAGLRFAGLVTEDRRKTRYRLGRAHPWPGGDRTRWTTNRSFMKASHPPIPIDQQGLVALFCLSAAPTPCEQDKECRHQDSDRG